MESLEKKEQPEDGYGFDGESLEVEEKFDSDFYLKNPMEIFRKNRETQSMKFKQHLLIMDKISDIDNHLGIGNDGFVMKVETPDGDLNCIKIVWKNLDVIFGKNITEKDAEENFEPEIITLYKIQKIFEKVRQKTREILSKGNIEKIPTNSPQIEAAIQQVAHKIIEESDINCTIPSVLSVKHNHEYEPLVGDYSYQIDQEYDYISMEEIKGKSVEDIILNYPSTKDFIEAINIEEFRENLVNAVILLNKKGIRHQDLTARNIMFDLGRKRAAIIDFGKSSIKTHYMDEDRELEMVNEVILRLQKFINNPEEESKKLKKALNMHF